MQRSWPIHVFPHVLRTYTNTHKKEINKKYYYLTRNKAKEVMKPSLVSSHVPPYSSSSTCWKLLKYTYRTPALMMQKLPGQTKKDVIFSPFYTSQSNMKRLKRKILSLDRLYQIPTWLFQENLSMVQHPISHQG